MQVVCGIILSFPRLYPTGGQITHALLSRLPLYHCGRSHDHARLACIKRAASVHPEPGSNSLNENLTSFHYSAVKEPLTAGGLRPQRPASSATLSGFDLVVNTRRTLTRTQFDQNFHCERGVAISLALDTSSDNETAASLDPHAIKPGLRESDRPHAYPVCGAGLKKDGLSGRGRSGCFAFHPTPALTAWQRRRRCWRPSVRRSSCGDRPPS